MSSPTMSHRLNISSDIDLRVTVLSGSGDQDFTNYSDIVVSVINGGDSSIIRKVVLNNYDNRVRVDVDFIGSTFFTAGTDYTILVKLVGINNTVPEINLADPFLYKARPNDNFDVTITSNSNYENIDTPSGVPTPNMTIKLDLASTTSGSFFQDVINVNLIIEKANMLETLQIPVKGLITKGSPINIYLNKLADDGSYNTLVLETSGNAYDLDVLNTNNVVKKDLSNNLFTHFGEQIHAYITLETEYGFTPVQHGRHTLSRTPNTANIGVISTNITASTPDYENLFLEFELRPNLVDINNVVPKEAQISRYKLDVSVNDTSYNLTLFCQQDASYNYINELKVKIDGSGNLTTENINTGVDDISGKFIGLGLNPLNYYTIRVKAFSDQEEGFSPVWAEKTSDRLEKQPDVQVVVAAYDNFFNNRVTDFSMNFIYSLQNTTVAPIEITPHLNFKYFTDGAETLANTDETQPITPYSTSSTEPTKDFVFDMSAAGDNALLANEILIHTEFKVEYSSGVGYSLYKDISGLTSFKTLEVVYSDLSFIDFSLNSSSGQPGGFQLTLQPHTEIYEFRGDVAQLQKGIYDSDSFSSYKNRITTNLSSVDISYNGATQELDLNNHSNNYVFNVSADYLGEEMVYKATLNHDAIGLAPFPHREASISVRVNDVSRINLVYEDVDFTINGTRGYTLDIAVLQNVGLDQLEILYDGSQPADASFTINEPDKITYNYPNIPDGTQLLVSLDDGTTGANGKKEVFVFQN
jgi:hypothetical protein